MSGIGTAIGLGVASIATGVYGANKAASAGTQAAQTAANAQLQEQQVVQQAESPWITAGGQAQSALSQFYGLPGAGATAGAPAASAPNYGQILQNLPGYQFQMQQGTQAVDQNLAAQGLLQSGAAGTALQQYGQGLAQNYAGQYASGLAGISQLGQAGAAGVAANATQTGAGLAGSAYYGGNAAAGGAIGQASAINYGLAGLSNQFNNYGSSYGGPSSSFLNNAYQQTNPYQFGPSDYIQP